MLGANMLFQSDDIKPQWEIDSSNKSRVEVLSSVGEVPIEQAIASCCKIAEIAGLGSLWQDIAKVSRIIDKEWRNPNVLIYFHNYEYSFCFNVQRNKISWFMNTNTSIQGKPKTQRPMNLNDPINVKGYVNALAKKLKCPSDYQLSTYECKIFESQPSWLTKDNPSSISAVYEPRISSYPVDCSSYKFRLIVDPIDGLPIDVQYGTDIPYDYNKPNVKVSFAQAMSLIDKAAEEYGILAKYRQKRTDPSKFPTRFLAYVNPNKEWLAGDRKRPVKTEKNHLRLAWVQKYTGTLEVWIDAETGDYLGGDYEKPYRRE